MLNRSRWLLIASIFVSALRAQSNPSTTPTPGVATPRTVASETGSPIVELSPFTVNSSADVGYRAQNTLSGSRLNASLKDTPGVLDVLTKDFLDDIGATTLQEALAFSTNFAEDNGDFDSQGVINTVFPGSQASVNFRTRGLGGTLARNYLETDSRPAFYTVERIDNSSGPNSILFGLGSAGGVANITTKRAKLNRHTYSFDLLFDSNNSRRVTVDANQVLVPNVLGLRVNAIANRGKKYRANGSTLPSTPIPRTLATVSFAVTMPHRSMLVISSSPIGANSPNSPRIIRRAAPSRAAGSQRARTCATPASFPISSRRKVASSRIVWSSPPVTASTKRRITFSARRASGLPVGKRATACWRSIAATSRRPRPPAQPAPSAASST